MFFFFTLFLCILISSLTPVTVPVIIVQKEIEKTNHVLPANIPSISNLPDSEIKIQKH